MKLHGNARLTPHGRKLLVERVCEQRVSLQEAARAAGVSTRTASKWVARYRREGTAGLYDRSSAPPGHVPRVTAGTEIVEFSPTAEYGRTLEVLARNFAALQGG